MKKEIIICTVLMVMLICTSCYEKDIDKQIEPISTMFCEEPNIDQLTPVELMAYVDEKIKIVSVSEKYIQGDVNAKVQLLEPVLDRLREGGFILEYECNFRITPANISVEYSCGGSLVIMLEDFSEDQN